MDANAKRSLSMSLKGKVRKGSSSKYKGVSFSKTKVTNKWRAYITINKKIHQLGYFQHEEAAAKAYDKKALEHFGTKACLNFPATEGVE